MMPWLTPNELSLLNHRGFLPLQGEDEAAFLKRVAILEGQMTSSLPQAMQNALVRCEQLFDVKPDWVPFVEQQSGLAPWQGAVLWIQEDAHGNSIPLIQLSPRLKKSWLSKWYSDEEVIAHELVHAMRLPLHSSRFEEITAYQTSKNFLRRSLGPLFRHPYEVYILLGAVVVAWMGLFWDAFSLLLWIPWILCLFGVGRLFFSQVVFKRCRIKLGALLQDKRISLAVMARLTDAEISLIASSSPEATRSYIRECKEKQLRWRILCSIYLINI